MKRHGIFLINLGTPDSAEPEAVGRYLKEFLMDPWVIDIPFPLRWILVNLLIVPKRRHASAKLYQKIWTSKGSPLLDYTSELESKLQIQLGDHYRVVSGMRYGKPSLKSALERLDPEGLSRLTVIPLYPQYSLAATESSVRLAKKLLADRFSGVPTYFVPAFYDKTEYLDSVVLVSQKPLADFSPDKVLFSFHGLPERQVKKTDRLAGTHCLKSGACCDAILSANQDCYRAQCYYTARVLAEKLGIGESKYEVGFQSRLKGSPWIQPFSDEFYRTLASQGVKKLAVLCPSFVADCLETLEEVQIRGKEEFIQHGGKDLLLIPSLNAEPIWVSNLAKLLEDLPA